MSKVLDIIQGTHYEVDVVRDSDGDYSVTVLKPAHMNDPYADHEVIGQFYLDNGADIQKLNYRVAEVIDKDKPSLVGHYTGGEIFGYQYE